MRKGAFAVALLCAGATSACRDRVVPPPTGSGSYVLERVDGSELPATLTDGTVIDGGTLGLDAAATSASTGVAHLCVSNTDFTPPGGLATTATLLCKWKQNRQSISVDWSSAVLNFGILAEDVLTLTMHATAAECPPVPDIECPSSVWVYRR